MIPHSAPLMRATRQAVFRRPHPIVVEGSAAERGDGVGAGQRVDAAAVGVGGIGPDRFRNQHAAAHAVENFGVDLHLAALVAERDVVAVGDAERRGVVGMDHHRGPTLAGERGWRFGEGRIEKAARRRRGQAERMLGVRLLDHLPMVGKFRNGGRRGCPVPAAERHFRPVRLETEFLVRISEAVEVMRGGEIRLAIDPAVSLDLGKRAPAGFLQRARRSARAASWRSPDARRPAAAPARRSPRDWSGIRRAARSASARAECIGCRRPYRSRRARRTSWRAGSTSATFAVSVMNCSCTQTNRSSRAKPRLTTS